MLRDYFRPNVWAGQPGSPVTTFHIDRDRRDIDVSDAIYDLVPDASPFLVVLAKARKAAKGSMEITWFDSRPAEHWLKVTEEASDSATKVKVEDASVVTPKTIIKVAPDGEILFVSAVSTSTNTLTVVREYGKETIANTHIGGTPKAVIPAGADLLVLGNAMEENSLAPEATAAQPTKLWNYMQEIRTPFEGSLHEDREGVITNQSERQRLSKNKSLEHKLALERACLFGERNEHIGDRRRTMGGVFQFIKSNLYDVGSTNNGILTETEWTNFLEQGMWYGSERKLFVCSPKVLSVIDQFAAGRIQTVSGEETFGLTLGKYISTHGEVLLAKSKVFEKAYGNTGLLLDIENISYCPLSGEDTHLSMNIQENDRRGWKDEYITVATTEVRLEATHAILTGVER